MLFTLLVGVGTVPAQAGVGCGAGGCSVNLAQLETATDAHSCCGSKIAEPAAEACCCAIGLNCDGCFSSCQPNRSVRTVSVVFERVTQAEGEELFVEALQALAFSEAPRVVVSAYEIDSYVYRSSDLCVRTGVWLL